MFKQIAGIFVVLAVASLLPNASAIKCYQCKSLTLANCAKEMIDGTMSIPQVDCDSVPRPNTMEQLLPVTKCNKVITSDKAGVIVSRDCHFETIGQKNNVCTVSHSTQVDECHTCSGDLCNASSAGRLAAVGVVALFSLVAASMAF